MTTVEAMDGLNELNELKSRSVWLEREMKELEQRVSRLERCFENLTYRLERKGVLE